MSRTFLLLLLLVPYCVNAVHFRIKAGETRCFGEDVRDGLLVHGNVGVSDTIETLNGGGAAGMSGSSALQLHFQVQDSAQNVLFDIPEVGRTNAYSFTAHEANAGTRDEDEAGQQEYRFCFTDNIRQGAAEPPYGSTRDVSFTLDLGADIDWKSIATKDKLDPLHLALRQLEDTAKAVNDNFDVAKNREMRHRDTNESTNARVAWISGFSLAIVASLGVMQLFYLKQFFKSKKLI